MALSEWRQRTQTILCLPSPLKDAASALAKMARRQKRKRCESVFVGSVKTALTPSLPWRPRKLQTDNYLDSSTGNTLQNTPIGRKKPTGRWYGFFRWYLNLQLASRTYLKARTTEVKEVVTPPWQHRATHVSLIFAGRLFTRDSQPGEEVNNIMWQ